MTTLVRRGTARRLGLRDPARWRRLAELIESAPGAAEVFEEYERPVVDIVRRKRDAHAQAWTDMFTLTLGETRLA